MSFGFNLDQVKPLLEATFLLTRLSDEADIKFSPEKFSLTVSHLSPPFTVVLQIIPQFFTHFFSDHTHFSRIPLLLFHRTISHINQTGFSSLTLSLDQQNNRLLLQFPSSRDDEQPIPNRHLALSDPAEEDVGQIDLRSSVSIGSRDFRRIVLEFANDDLVRVVLTYSRVKFCSGTKEIILTVEENRCVIDGVRVGREIEFLITIHPMTFFRNMTRRAKRVWLFKTTNSESMIIAPFGLHAQYMIFYPYRM